jgi:uncharacterized protein YndB with AHSA1/START domain
MSEPVERAEVRLEIRIAASPETVFAFLTEPERLKLWLADVVEADARPSGAFRISGPAGGTIEGTYLEVVPHRKIVLSWGGMSGLLPGESTVEFLIEPHAGGTLLRLRHHGLPASTLEPHRRGWGDFGLVKLKAAAEGCPPAVTCVADVAASRAAVPPS